VVIPPAHGTAMPAPLVSTLRWALALAGIGGALTASAGEGRPNLLVILADDLGFSDLGCHGGEIDTPNLDRLAAGGLRFTQAYNTARCWPSRGALLTGFYAQSIRRDALPGGSGGSQGRRPAWARLLPELLEPAGYRSYHSGKWHIDGDPRAAGFVRSLDVRAANQSNYFDATGVTDDGRPLTDRPDFYATTAIGDHAVACLREHARDHAGTPFFHYVAFTAPHFPLHAPQELIARYRDRYRAGWDHTRRARHRKLVAQKIVQATLPDPERDVGPPYDFPNALAKLGPGEVRRPIPWTELTPEQQDFQATKMAIHAAMVDAMDGQVGRILAQLEAMAALDDTLVLFASDNGCSAEIMIRGEGHDPAAPPGSRKTFLCLGPGWSTCSNTPFRRHKTWVHEGGIATPWIVHWPAGITGPGGLRRQPVHVIDLVPTVLELAGVSPPGEVDGHPVPPMQGRSFAPALREEGAASARADHTPLWWCHEGHRAVRIGDWKLVADKRKGPHGGGWELYDLADDRTETRDLAASDPARVAAMEAEWERIAAECRALAASPEPVGGTRRRPNIIYVMTDDQGYGDVAALGNPVLSTPNLDRLHGQSVRLTEFHVSPTCAPTRAALFTGRHEFRSGVTHTIHERERLARSAITLPQLLQEAGYTTGIFGKWHLGDEEAYQPDRRGFERVFIHGGGGIGQTYPGSCGDAPGNTYFSPLIRSDGRFVQTWGYCTDVLFDEALDWIDRCRRRDRPFFCCITTNTPHTPLDCPLGSDLPYRRALAKAEMADPKRRGNIARFYGMITNIDDNMGRLMDRLDQWGLAEDTVLVFSTDNGTATGAPIFNDGMRGAKGSPHRGGTRVPAFWRWSGTLPAGIDVSAVTAHVDVLPTLCELAAVALPAEVAGRLEGRSLVPLLADPAADWPDRPMMTHVGRWERGAAAASRFRNCRIREGRWQMVNTRGTADGWTLFDLAADPGETRDLAAEQPDVVTRLAATYQQWWESVLPDLVNEDLDGPAENPFATAYWEQFGPRPSHAAVPYGPHPRQIFHVWLPAASDTASVPLVFHIHGGGWQGGDRMYGVAPLLDPLLDAGIAVATIDYRFISDALEAGIEPPVQAPLTDAARALQTIRSRAGEWNIDPVRIVATGESAGGYSSLWLAFHDDLADPANEDPVARESTRLFAAAVSRAQTSLDPAEMRQWIPGSRYGGHAFGFLPEGSARDRTFQSFLAARDRLEPQIARLSPAALVSADDPPVYLVYDAPPAIDGQAVDPDPTHSAVFGVKLRERLDAVGVRSELVYPGAADITHASILEFLLATLAGETVE
jgi:arylsulfatase A-like enzyme